MACQTEKGKIEPGRERVVLTFPCGQIARDLRMREGQEGSQGGGLVGRGPQNLANAFEPIVKTLPKFGNMGGRILDKAVMRKKQALRLARQNFGQGFVPEMQIDVRRRSGRQDVRTSVNAHSGRIADVSDAFPDVKVADVMR